MAKYLINVPDEIIEFMNGKFDVFIEPEVKVGECRHYKVRLDDTEITPYTEQDREAIENEAWEFAKTVSIMKPEDKRECWGTDKYNTINLGYSYQETKAKYESWKAEKAEIRVGDELKDDENIRAVVLDIIDEDYVSYEVFTENGIVDEWQKGIVVKTGHHFPEVAELLKKMREE